MLQAGPVRIPTYGFLMACGFLVAIWLASRAGLKLVPMLAIGFGVWGVGVGIIAILRRSGVV